MKKSPRKVLSKGFLFPVTFPLGSNFSDSLKIVRNTSFYEYYTGLAVKDFDNCSFSHHYLPSGCLPEEKLVELNKEINAGGKRLIIPLNVVSYRPSWRGFLLRQLEKITRIGAFGVVVSNLGILSLVKSNAPDLKIHISSVAGVSSAEAVKFFKRQGADRVILPRSMRAIEVVALASRFSDIEIEAFIMGGGCAFSEHSCNLPHFIFEREDKLSEIGSMALHLCPHRGGCQSPALLTFVKNNTRQLRMLHPGYMGCGICYIPEFLKAGVHRLKVTGRTQFSRKLVKQAEMVENIMQKANRRENRYPEIKDCNLEKPQCLYEKQRKIKVLPETA